MVHGAWCSISYGGARLVTVSAILLQVSGRDGLSRRILLCLSRLSVVTVAYVRMLEERGQNTRKLCMDSAVSADCVWSC